MVAVRYCSQGYWLSDRWIRTALRRSQRSRAGIQLKSAGRVVEEVRSVHVAPKARIDNNRHRLSSCGVRCAAGGVNGRGRRTGRGRNLVCRNRVVQLVGDVDENAARV